mmetsp:Transcript_148260/g.385359  ORF Transcript_148260/g.385359 Transcript_148260/m.385359 type:complete len:290 (-) Transcript_148260:115-984(-)
MGQPRPSNAQCLGDAASLALLLARLFFPSLFSLLHVHELLAQEGKHPQQWKGCKEPVLDGQSTLALAAKLLQETLCDSLHLAPHFSLHADHLLLCLLGRSLLGHPWRQSGDLRLLEELELLGGHVVDADSDHPHELELRRLDQRQLAARQAPQLARGRGPGHAGALDGQRRAAADELRDARAAALLAHEGAEVEFCELLLQAGDSLLHVWVRILTPGVQERLELRQLLLQLLGRLSEVRGAAGLAVARLGRLRAADARLGILLSLGGGLLLRLSMEVMCRAKERQGAQG